MVNLPHQIKHHTHNDKEFHYGSCGTKKKKWGGGGGGGLAGWATVESRGQSMT